jgi:hypothetical protein
VFYAIGEHSAIGFDPWAIDTPTPGRNSPPLVDRHDQAWGPHAGALRDSYLAIARAMHPIVEAQGTPRLFTFVQEPGESGAFWEAEGVDVQISYTDAAEAARGMVIQFDEQALLLVGVGFTATFQRPYPSSETRPIRSVVMGAYEGDRWAPHYPVEGHRAYFLEPGVARVTLD